MNFKHKRKTALFYFIYIILYFFLILLISEFIYRYQIIDTYQPEFKEFNKNLLSHETTDKTILIFGDSFTAGKFTYPYFIHQQRPDFRIVNSAVSGSGIIETLFIAPKRIKKFKPDIMIYQVYVGNDLLNISYPVNWKKLSFIRNLYWSLAEHFRFLSFLNYRLGQIYQAYKQNKNNKQQGKNRKGKIKIIRNYDKNEKLYLSAEPFLLENSILVRSNRKKDFNIWLKGLDKLITYASACDIYILIIPHPCQVHKKYLNLMNNIGAQFHNPSQIQADEYPFIKNIQNHFKDRADVYILNPLMTLRENENKSLPVYHSNNAHLNITGQKIIAKFLINNMALSSAPCE